MLFTFLGTGTSQGIPIIGCGCPVCTSPDPRNNRLRASVLIQTENETFVIDAGPDFRQQMLRAQVKSLDALLISHEHSDHIAGLDDIRPFNFINFTDLPVYADARVQGVFRKRFDYIFAASYPGVPMVALHTIQKNESFFIGKTLVQPIQYWHGKLPIFGFRIGSIAYLTDFKSIDEDELSKIKGIDTLVISALHHEEHHSHSTFAESIAWVERIAPRRAFFMHLSHNAGLHSEQEALLPPHIRIAYDGLQLEIED